MSRQTYHVKIPVRGEMHTAGRTIAYDLAAGDHPAIGDDAIVLSRLARFGLAEMNPAKRKPARDGAVPADVEKTAPAEVSAENKEA